MASRQSSAFWCEAVLRVAALLTALLAAVPILQADLVGPQKFVVLRVRFSDYAEVSRFTEAEVQGLFDNELNGLWGDISYGAISIDATVTDLLELPGARADYIEEGDDGIDTFINFDTSWEFKRDAIDVANAAGVDFTDAAGVVFLMAETDPTQYIRASGGRLRLPIGPGGAGVMVATAHLSENPSQSETRLWGGWAHEIGHGMAYGSPRPALWWLHPSNYNSNFELMDHLYPGQSGMFTKHHADCLFSDWMPDEQYVVYTPEGGGGTAYVAAEEIPPADVEALPPLAVDKAQAVKVELTPDLYYLVSVRKRLNGDEIAPIPDEGGLIERVVIGGDPAFNDCPDHGGFCPRWVNIQGFGGDRDVLWKTGAYNNAADGVTIQVAEVAGSGQSVYQVSVFFDAAASVPDVMINPWLTPPEANYETTDIWIDSSCNGYDTYQHGTITPSGDATPVGAGNGDNPCANMENRVYVRVRNIGGAAATNVVVHFDVTDPLGLGINGANGFVEIGSVDRTDFPGLAIIEAGEYVDVYYAPWTPVVAPEDLVAGFFNFHSCLRVRVDPVADETNTANQDGHTEQENIAQFYASPAGAAAAEAASPPIDQIIHLRNDSGVFQRSFNLFWDSDLPPEWTLTINDGVQYVELGPNEVRDIPVHIVPGGPRLVGQRFRVRVGAESWRYFINDKDPTDKHLHSVPLGGVTLEVRIADPTSLEIDVQRESGGIQVTGRLTPVLDRSAPVLLRLLNAQDRPLASEVVRANTLGSFVASFSDVPGAAFVDATFVGGEFQQPATRRAAIPSATILSPSIPTVSGWGYAILVVLFLTSGYVLLRRGLSY